MEIDEFLPVSQVFLPLFFDTFPSKSNFHMQYLFFKTDRYLYYIPLSMHLPIKVAIELKCQII